MLVVSLIANVVLVILFGTALFYLIKNKEELLLERDRRSKLEARVVRMMQSVPPPAPGAAPKKAKKASPKN